MGLSLHIGLITNINHTKSKSYIEKSNIRYEVNIGNEIDNEIFWANGLLPTNVNLPIDPKHTKSKICNDQYNMSNRVNNEIS